MFYLVGSTKLQSVITVYGIDFDKTTKPYPAQKNLKPKSKQNYTSNVNNSEEGPSWEEKNSQFEKRKKKKREQK